MPSFTGLLIVVAVAIGQDLDLVTAAEGAALIGAGLLSVLLFPLVGLQLLRGGTAAGDRPGSGGEAEPMMAM